MFREVMSYIGDHRYQPWWYAIVAGLGERWAAGQELGNFKDDFLKAMLAFDIANSVSKGEEESESHQAIGSWRRSLIESRPELVKDAYFAIVQLRFSRGESVVDGLRDLLHEPAFEPFRPQIVLDLLREFPDADPSNLDNLLDGVISLPASAISEFMELAEPIIAGVKAVGERQSDLWLATACVIEPCRFANEIRQRVIERKKIIFDLRDKMGAARRSHGAQIPLSTIEFMAKLTGMTFEYTRCPTGVTLSGNASPWDASEHFVTLIEMISASPGPSATEALQRLSRDEQLASYKDHILHALENQQRRRLDNEYDRPDWSRTVAALDNRAPATVSDLHALLVDQLHDLSDVIAHENTDPFKKFWNVNSHSKPTEPRPEEDCRDSLIDLLRPRLSPVGITVEPEGHMAHDKRADISVAMPRRKILCELKRDYHAEVWTAATEQLDRFYAHDPEAKGYGIYVVFWFGEKRPRDIPCPPNCAPRPETAEEMERMLRDALPGEMSRRLEVIVIDVSGKV
jgi:hypothetical protein